MIEAYLKENEGRYSAATLNRWGHWLRRLNQRGDLCQMKSAELLEWHKEMSWKTNERGVPYSVNTLNQAVVALRSF